MLTCLKLMFGILRIPKNDKEKLPGKNYPWEFEQLNSSTKTNQFFNGSEDSMHPILLEATILCLLHGQYHYLS